jgi:hypothetical protein
LSDEDSDTGWRTSEAADKNYTTTFISELVVVVDHNLNKQPSVTVIDTAEDEIEVGIVHNSVNQLTLTMSALTSGTVFCN